jgi:hypothetical protein
MSAKREMTGPDVIYPREATGLVILVVFYLSLCTIVGLFSTRVMATDCGAGTELNLARSPLLVGLVCFQSVMLSMRLMAQRKAFRLGNRGTSQ